MSLINSHQSADSGLNIWSQLFFYTIVTASEWIGGLQKRKEKAKEMAKSYMKLLDEN